MPELSPDACRVLGTLVEKAQTVPAQYPLTLNSIVIGVNQKNNRDPVVEIDEERALAALDELRGLGLVHEVVLTGSRVPKFRHLSREVLEVNTSELVLLAELLLRGPQTVGELRGRASRMHPLESLEVVGNLLDAMRTREPALVEELPPIPGTRGTDGGNSSARAFIRSTLGAPPRSRRPRSRRDARAKTSNASRRSNSGSPNSRRRSRRSSGRSARSDPAARPEAGRRSPHRRVERRISSRCAACCVDRLANPLRPRLRGRQVRDRLRPASVDLLAQEEVDPRSRVEEPRQHEASDEPAKRGRPDRDGPFRPGHLEKQSAGAPAPKSSHGRRPIATRASSGAVNASEPAARESIETITASSTATPATMPAIAASVSTTNRPGRCTTAA